MPFQFGGHAAQHGNGLGFIGFENLHQLEAARECGVFLNVLLVLGPRGGSDGAEHAARQGRLEQVGGVPGTRLTTGTNQGVHFVDEQNDWGSARLHFVEQGAQTVLKFTLHAGARL